MALLYLVSNGEVSAISPPTAGLPSALRMLTIQDPSIPMPGKCHIDRCAVEILIQVAESLDYQSLCSLARISKRYPEAAQDVLYRFVDLRPAEEDLEAVYVYNGCPNKSAIAMFLRTIQQKPHLATKVRDLWFMPQSKPVLYPELFYVTAPFVPQSMRFGVRRYKVEEKKLACKLLSCLTELRSLTITALDEYLCNCEFGRYDISNSRRDKGVFERLPMRLEKLTNLPCFWKLTSIYVSHGKLDWAIATLPTLHTLCIGTGADVKVPSPYAEAANITTLIIEVEDGTHENCFLEAITILDHLPNVHTLTLGSYLSNGGDHRFPRSGEDHFGGTDLGNTGSFPFHIVQTLLDHGRSIENLIFTYSEPVRFGDTTTVRLDVREFEQLRRIQIAECGLVDSHDFQRLAGSGPSQLLPRRIRTLVITHPRSPGPDDGDRKSKLASWLKELTKTDFPDLERVEVVCWVGYGDGVGFKQRLEQSAEVRFLETIGVAVVVRKE